MLDIFEIRICRLSPGNHHDVLRYLTLFYVHYSDARLSTGRHFAMFNNVSPTTWNTIFATLYLVISESTFNYYFVKY